MKVIIGVAKIIEEGIKGIRRPCVELSYTCLKQYAIPGRTYDDRAKVTNSLFGLREEKFDNCNLSDIITALCLDEPVLIVCKNNKEAYEKIFCKVDERFVSARTFDARGNCRTSNT